MRLRALSPLILVLIIVVAGALLLSGGGRSSSGPVKRTLTPVGGGVRSSPVPQLPPGRGALIALVMRRAEMRAAPNGRVLGSVDRRDQFGSPWILLVDRISTQWLGVVSELAGNGRLGWIPRSAVALGRNPYSLRASLSARILTVSRDGSVLARYTVGIGASDAPTPTGRFAVTDRLVTHDPQGPYGCCILGLSATAPHAIPGWTGGNRIAIHATPDTQTIGEPDSHGCLHVTQAEGRRLIGTVPLGTPTVITG